MQPKWETLEDGRTGYTAEIDGQTATVLLLSNGYWRAHAGDAFGVRQETCRAAKDEAVKLARVEGLLSVY